MIVALFARGGSYFGDNFGEITREPLLATACVVLVVVSVEWIVVARLIIHNYKKAARRGDVAPAKVDVVRPPRDIWSYPPPDADTGVTDATGTRDSA